MEYYFWLVFGMVFQFMFFMRFFVQWVVSEKEKKSVIPISFWYLSLIGSLGLLIYAIYKKDLVFIIGLGGGSFIYIRNLILIYRNGKNKK